MEKKPASSAGRRGLAILVLLTLIGGGLYLVGFHAWAWYQMRAGEQALAARRFARARKHLENALWAWPSSSQACFAAARAARLERDYRSTDVLLDRCRRLGGIPEQLELETAMARAQRGDFAGLEKYLWAYVEGNYLDAPFILEALAQGYLHHNRWPQALAALNRLIGANPNVAEFFFWRGGVRESLGDLESAGRDFERAVDLDATLVPARLGLAQIHLRQSRPQEAVDQFESIRSQRSSDPAMLLGLGRAYRECGRFDEARLVLGELLAKQPQNPLALAERGKLAWSEGQVDQAEDWLRRSLALAPRERETNYFLYLCLERTGKTQEAKESLVRFKEIEADQDQLIKLYSAMVEKPSDMSLPCAVAELLMRNQQDDQALMWLEGVLQHDAHYRPAHALLADLHQRRGNVARAERHRLLSQ